MKRFLLSWMLAMLAGSLMLNAQNMSDSHQLTALWKQYEQAHKADLPQKEAAILAQIKEEAAAKHLPVDFYDAATTYVSTVERRDWKQRDALRKGLEKEVESFDDPLVTFLYKAEWQNAASLTLLNYVENHPDGFQGCHPALHRGVDGVMNGSMKPFIRNDKEYVLWYVAKRYYGADNDATRMLGEEVKGIYPNEAILEYFQLNHTNWPSYKLEQEKKAYRDLADKYAGKAFSVYPRAELLRIKFGQLQNDKADGPAFKALYEEIRVLEKERKSYTGDDKVLVAGCPYLESMLSSLTDKQIDVMFEGREVVLQLRNLEEASVTLYDVNKSIKTWKVKNKANTFYVKDTLRLALPALSDGEYSVEARNGKISDLDSYTQYTLSIATRMDSRGRCVYVTDYDSGVPLRSATLHLRKSGDEIATSTLRLDGFTPLPTAFAKHLDGSSATWEVFAQSGSRRSRSIILDRRYNTRNYDDHVRCNIYRDRGAYNPGDTLQFKAVVYKGDPALGLEAVKDHKVKMVLKDSEGNELETLQLTTNEWGAVSGSFAIPSGLRNGHFELTAEGLASDWFPVDEFVLPSFDLTFDKVEKLYLVGDEVPVSGKLTSYSGHSLAGARIRVKVSRYGQTVFDGDVPVGDDNTFQAAFPTKESGYYHADVTVTEATGETHEFGTGWYITDDLNVLISVVGAEDTDLFLTGPEGGDDPYYWRRSRPRFLVQDPSLKLVLDAADMGGNTVPLPVSYELTDASGLKVASGETPSGETLQLTLPADGMYRLKASVSVQDARGKKVEADETAFIVCLSPDAKKLCPQVKRVFVSGPREVAPGGAVTARIGTTEGDAWAVVTLYGDKREVLVHEAVHVKDGAVENLSYAYKAGYSDAVRLQVFYFIHGQAVQYSREYRRARDKYSMPLEFTRFQDKAFPGTEYSFTIRTAPGTEVLVAAWDKSMDAISRNRWPLVNMRDFSVDGVYVSSACGLVGRDSPVIAYGYGSRLMSKSAGNLAMAPLAAPAETVLYDEMAVDAEERSVTEGSAEFASEAPVPREKFASALTFQPHLRPEADGTLNFSFRTSDKLSTYYVSVYAHDQQMHNALLQQEMVVSLPVKVSILEPRYLYAGDVYNAAVTLSSTVNEAVSGTLALQVGDDVREVPVTVPAGKTVTQYFPLEVPREGAVPSSLEITASFRAAEFSDAVRVHVPVYAASQQLTESHSAVLRAGMSRTALLSELRSRFVNVPGSEAILQDISVLDMVKDAIPSHVDPKNNDVLSLSEAWYVRLMASRLGNSARESSISDEELLAKILACRNADGGFAWFEGMRSNSMITAVMLERFAKLRDRGFEVPDMTATVKYLDKVQFGDSLPYWCGWVSDAQYVYVRSLYASVPFTEKAVTQAQKKRAAQFAKDMKDYLLPSKKDGRGLHGQILAKARRLLTLRILSDSERGLAITRAWGITQATSAKLKASVKADLASLLEYAVEHRDGGWYYPNAVMPWRGLMESEAYAHALLCDLLKAEGDAPSASKVADGVRLWLMLQKETQKWDSEPEFIDAITAILDGSEAVLNTRVLALSATYEAPLEKIKASGNGFTLERRFFREGVEINPGDQVKVGDKISVQYRIWNGENRSFVKVTAGREASLSPVQQLSGHIGYGFIVPRRGGYVWSFQPQGYRNVKAAATEYYFDSYPEENTTLTEEFFVERAGAFVAPVTVIESLYAPHYRANSASRPPLRSEIR